MDKTNHGPCLVCGRPILYLAARFCSPGCNFDFLANGVRVQEEPSPPDPEPHVEEAVPVTEAVLVTEAPVPEPEPEPVVLSEPEPSGFMSLTPPPDEPPVKRRRIYF